MFTEEETLKLIENSKKLAFDKLKNNEYKFVKTICNQLLKVSLDDTDAYQFLGICEFREGNFEEAKAHFSKILKIKKDEKDVENINNIALCYGNLGDHKTAIKYLEKCRKNVQNNEHLDSNLLMQYRFAGKTKKAIKLLNDKIEKDPNSVKDLAFLGGCYAEAINYKKACKYLNRALEIDPDFDFAKIDLASIYQFSNQSEKAWPLYEARFKVYDQCKYWKGLFDEKKEWNGTDDLSGKRIILHSEQGSGDIIHFVRYVKMIRSMGATVILHCWDSMKDLLSHLADELYLTEPVIRLPLIHGKPTLPEYDYFAAIMSLPYLLKTKEIPNPPYIFANKRLDFSSYSEFFKIGICWAGTPAHPNDFHRSVKLELFRDISNLPSVKLFSLTKDTRPRKHKFQKEEVDLAENAQDMSIVDMAEFMNSYDDTASIISEMDLVIAVDTSVLHIAGALNHQTLAIIPQNPDWRWGNEGDKSKWYPSIKMFRKENKNSWEKTFNDIKEEVIKRMDEKLN